MLRYCLAWLGLHWWTRLLARVALALLVLAGALFVLGLVCALLTHRVYW